MAINFSQPLAFVSFLAHGKGILEKRGPMKPILQHLPGNFMGSEMASTCILIAVAEYSVLLCFRHTPSDYLINTIFAQEGFFPIIGVNFCKEEFLVLCFPICW